MEPETFPDEPTPIRRKPGRPPKTRSPALKKPVPDPFLNEADDAVETPEPPTPQLESLEPRVDAGGNVPTLLIAVAFVLFLFAQALGLMQAKSSLAWQSQNLERQAESIRALRDSTSALLQERKQLVEESQRVSSGYNQFLLELIELAKTDKDAKATVEKFQIKAALPSEQSADPQ